MADGSLTSLVALRDRRESTIELLSDSFAADLLTLDQVDDRIARAHAATTVAELDALTTDLTPAKSTALVPLAKEVGLAAPKKRLRSLFSSVERHGAWVVPAELSVAATFGSVVLDFRVARLTAATTVVDVRVIFGSLEIIVPPDLSVECEGEGIFGSFATHGDGQIPAPGRPRLVIRGRALFGSVDVHTRMVGEGAWQARFRRWRERKGIAARRPPALPGASDD